MSVQSETSTTPTLAEEQRAMVRARILRAARRVLAEDGLDATVEDIAIAAGVSRRTVFRYFPTRHAMFAAAVNESIRSYADHIPRPRPGTDLTEWLGDALRAAHRLNAGNGRIYWDLALRPGIDGVLGEISAQRRAARRAFVAELTTHAWKLAGGRRRPPEWLVDAFAVQLSTFTTKSLASDFDRTPDQVAEVAIRVLVASIDAARRQSPRGA